VAATSVPDAIYAMPPESPIYYVTNVYVYGSTPEYVYTGYTPGYFGTCVCPQSVVVYGTGWNFVPWVGRYWYGRPWTYGWGARFAWTSAGWGFGFATACSRPWWGPVGWHGGWGGTGWNAGWNRGWGGGYANAHINNFNFNNANVYNRWGNNVHVNQNINRNTTINAPRNTQVINNRRDLNNVIAGHDGNVYRRDGQGWASHNGNQWQHVEPANLPDQQRKQFENTQRQLNQEWSARKQGNVNHDQFQARSPEVHPTPAQRQPAAGNAGFHGNPGGFRGNPSGGRRR
jgi:hypothetical protein